ncbi:desmoplakin-B [Alosa pseudoharengus]|uniref:desmoplakin-B n=1 Tax=Alosa pseudoharengus TaxID=34774 RepID=UPI003F8BAC97
MSLYGSQRALNISQRGSRTDLTGGGYPYARSEMVGGNGYAQEYVEGYYTYTKGSGSGVQRSSSLAGPHQRAMLLQDQCQDALQRAEMLLQAGGGDASRMREVEHCMGVARERIDQLKGIAVELRQMGQPNDNVVRSVDQCREQLKGVHMAMSSSMQRRTRSSRGSSSWDETPGRSYQEALAWIGQQKRLIETCSWADEPAGIEQQLLKHNRFHSSIQRSPEVDRAREELMQRGDKGGLYSLDQEWDSLQKLSFIHTQHLRELQSITEEICREIMWVNEREEEELVFNWGHQNIDTYIPRKQESYSRLMSALEDKEKDLNKLKIKVDNLLKSNHPASDKIQAYMETLQTQWSWLLQITKCISVHLKENSAYSQFFKEANDTVSRLQRDHENIRKKFTCSKTTPLPNLLELLQALETEKERLAEHKQQVAHLNSKAKHIVRLKPRNPEEKSSGQVIVKALLDFKQDQKVICKGDEGILKDNTQRSKWSVTGPGGLDMTVPSVCLLVPPPNPLSISLASKNEQYYEVIQSLWSQFYINIKSLISWQYCIQDINRIRSLTITMLYQMKPEEYHSIIRSLERHYQEFRQNCLGSQMFADEDKRSIESQYTHAQQHYDTLVTQLPTYSAQQQQQQQMQQQQQLNLRKQEVKLVQQEVKKQVPVQTKVVTSVSSTLLSDLSALRLRLEGAESQLTQYLHIPVGKTCTAHLTQLQGVQREVDGVRAEYERLKQLVLQQLQGITDKDKVQFLRSELGHINQRISLLEGFSRAYFDRCEVVCSLQQMELQVEDIVKVYEARLTERETTSLDPDIVQQDSSDLQAMQAELREKESVLSDMEAELKKAQQLNNLIDPAIHKCDIDLSQHAEQVSQLSDRWLRIKNQISSRVMDLDSYLVLLRRYLQSSSGLSDWIGDTRQRLDTMRATKMDDITVLTEHLSKQKELNSEILGKRGTVECVQRDADNLVNSIKDYELQLASYGAGLETLLNIPIKRNLLQSPALTVTQEVSTLQTRYIELLTSSSDFYKHLGQMLKNLQELKLRGTRIDLLEEELSRLRDELALRSAESLRLQEASRRQEEELSRSQDQLLTLEEAKRSQTMNLGSSQDRLQELLSKIQSLELQLEEEARKRKLVEERYSELQGEQDEEARRSQRMLDEARKTRMELEMSMADRDREAERLRLQLQEEAQRAQEAQLELKRARELHSSKLKEVHDSYESRISVTQTNVLLLQQQKGEQEQLQAENREAQDEAKRLRQALAEEQERRKRAEEDAQLQRKAAQEEQGKRRRVEVQLEQSTLTVQEYTVTLTALQRSQEEAAAELKEAWEEARARQEELDRLRREQGNSSSMVASLEEELRVLMLKLTQREAQTGEDNQRLKELQCLLEEKTQLLNESMAKIQRLQALTEKLTKERLQLEEEVRTLRLQQGEMRKGWELEQETRISELTLQIKTSKMACEEHLRLLKETSAERDKLREEVERLRKQVSTTSAELQRSEKQCAELRTQKGALERRVKELENKLEETQRLHQKLQQQMETLQRQLTTREADIKRLQVEKSELLLRIKKLEERPVVRHINTQTDDLRPVRDPAALMFQGVCAPVSAQQLQDCGLLKQPALEQLRKSERSVDQVDTQLQPALRGARVIAGMAAGPKGKMTLAEALRQKLLSRESAVRLLEAQAATGGLMDPTVDPQRRRRVEEGQATGLVPRCSSERLLEAESACLGVREPGTGQRLGVGQAHRRGLRDEAITLQLLQAQEAVGGVLDPRLSVFLPRDLATDRNLLDKEMYTVLNTKPASYLHPLTQRPCTYTSLQDTCVADPSTGHLLLPPTKAALCVQGLRADVPVWELVGVGLLEPEDLEHLLDGRLRLDDIQLRLRAYLRECGCVAGITDQQSGRTLTLQEAQQVGMLSKEATLELLEAQIACGFIMDPRDGRGYTVEEALKKGLVGAEYKEALLKAEKAVTGYSQPGGGPVLCLSEALQRGMVERSYGLRLLGAQLSSAGIIDPLLSVRIPPNTAVQRGLLAHDLRQALEAQGAISWGFSDPTDPNNQGKLRYTQLMKEGQKDPKTGLLLLPATVPSQKNTVRKRRVVIVDPDSGREMTVKQAYEAKLIDHETYVELAQQECEWEEITITAADGSKRLVIMDQTKGLKYDVQELLEKGVIKQTQLDQYRAGKITLAQLVDAISDGTKRLTSSSGLKTSTQTSASSNFSSSSGTRTSAASAPSSSATPSAASAPSVSTTSNFSSSSGTRTSAASAPSSSATPSAASAASVSTTSNFSSSSGTRTSAASAPSSSATPSAASAPSVSTTSNFSSSSGTRTSAASAPSSSATPSAASAASVSTTSNFSSSSGTRTSAASAPSSSATPSAASAPSVSTTSNFSSSSGTRTSAASAPSSSATPSAASAPSVSTTSNFSSSSGTRTSAASAPSSSATPSAASAAFVSTTSASPPKSSMTHIKSQTVSTSSVIISSSSPGRFISGEQAPLSPGRITSMSVNLVSPIATVGERSPVGVIFDSDTLERVSVTDAMSSGLLDNLTGQRLLEAQACTGGLVCPSSGRRLSLQEAQRTGLITDELASRLRPAQKAYVGFVEPQGTRRLSVAEAVKERWLPHEAGQRFLEFQQATGGLWDPQEGCRRSLEEAQARGWVDPRSAQKLGDLRQHARCLICPRSSLKLSYAEALERCLLEEVTGIMMLPAAKPSSTPGSSSGSCTGSRSGSRKGSIDLTSSSSVYTSFSYSSSSYTTSP